LRSSFILPGWREVDSVLLVHREADGQVEWHETQADVFVVQSGSARLVVGGTLVKLSRGDVVRIPALPHQLLLEGSMNSITS
jgi:mannose-6-phosphate isomerase-like protein (cupin superfamily)